MNEKPRTISSIYQDSINLTDLILLLKRNSYLILFSVISGWLLSYLYLQTVPVKYKSNAVLEIRDSQSSRNTISAASLLLNRGSGNKQQELFSQIIRSRSLSEKVLQDDILTRDLLAIDGFDLKNKQPEYNSKLYDLKKQAMKVKPNLLWVNSVTNSGLDIKGSGQDFMLISFKHPSPEFAANFIDFLVNQANALIRDRSLLEADAALDFLSKQMQSPINSSIKSSASELTLQQLDFKMKAFIYDDFVAKYVDHPFIPTSKDSPNSKIYLLIGTFLSFISIVLIILLNSFTIRLNKILKI